MFSFGNFAGCKIPFGVTLALECSSSTHLKKKKKRKVLLFNLFWRSKGQEKAVFHCTDKIRKLKAEHPWSGYKVTK